MKFDEYVDAAYCYEHGLISGLKIFNIQTISAILTGQAIIADPGKLAASPGK
jgi:hypothetical protein